MVDVRWLTPEAIELADRIEQVVNSAIGRADPDAIGGPVNWADLCCISVEFDTDGCVTALVTEASPAAGSLVAYLSRALKAAGIEDVLVRTEW